jgi:hypothetical protein
MDSVPTATVAYNRAGHLHRAAGCRCDFSADMPVGQPATITFSPRGRFALPEDAELINPDFSGRPAPLIVETMVVRVGDYDPVGVRQITFDLGGNVLADEDVRDPEGLRGFRHGVPSPRLTFSPKSADLSVYDPFAAFRAGTLATVYGVLGSQAGNRLYFEWLIQYEAPAYGDREGEMETRLTGRVKRQTGDAAGMLVFF